VGHGYNGLLIHEHERVSRLHWPSQKSTKSRLHRPPKGIKVTATQASWQGHLHASQAATASRDKQRA